MPSLMVISISNCGELFKAMLAHIGLFTRVNPLMHLKIASFIKNFIANYLFAIFMSDDLSAYELLLVLFASFDPWSQCLFLLLVDALTLEHGKVLV